MAKIKAIQFRSDYCANGETRFDCNKNYPVTAETERCRELGFGDYVTVDEKDLSQPNPNAAERHAAAVEAAVQAAAGPDAVAALAKLSEMQEKLEESTGIIDQAKSFVSDIAGKEVELAKAKDLPEAEVIRAEIEESVGKLKALFA